jgi:hypothetical protein
MLANPILAFDANITPAALNKADTESSYCCNKPVTVDGECSQCEMAAPVSQPLMCSECLSYVADLVPNGDTILECAHCSARWTEIDAGFDPRNLDGMEANAWNPLKAPGRFTTYLASMFGSEAAAVIPPARTISTGHRTRFDEDWAA